MNKIKLVEREQCSGCLACYNSCNYNSISIEKDERGFSFPSIDTEKCKQCACCIKACPMLNNMNEKPIFSSYLGQSKNDQTLIISASGGIATEINLQNFNSGSKVFGVKFDGVTDANYSLAENIEDINLFAGSKYVQSNVGLSFREIKSLLQKNEKVVFGGAPCQVAGLMFYLGRQYDNLLTVDFICHSIPSPRAFELYISYLEDRYGKVNAVHFKSKKYGYSFPLVEILTEKKKVYFTSQSDMFLNAFLSGKISRNCCYECKFRKTHYSDITLADCYDFDKTITDTINFRKGVNRIICWNQKGDDVINNLSQIKAFKVENETIIKKYDLIDHPCKQIVFPTKIQNEVDFFKKSFKVDFKNKIKSFLRVLIYKIGLQDLMKRVVKKNEQS